MAVFNPKMRKHLSIGGATKYHKQGYFGQGITVCVLDSGIKADHPEFEDRVLKDKCKSFLTADKEPLIDYYYHGTAVASTIAGKNVGYAPKANIISYKVIDPLGYADSKDIITALDYIYNEGYKYIDVVNISIVVGRDPSVVSGLYENAFNRVVLERGIPIVCASGNSSKEQDLYPAAFQEAISVGAVDLLQKKALFSTSSATVDVCQVGVDVWEAALDNGYAPYSGTSMAAPAVTGIAALLMCKSKSLFGVKPTEPEVYKMLKMSTLDIGLLGLDKDFGAGFCTLGNGKYVEFEQNKTTRLINGADYPMDVPVMYTNFRMFTPARYVAEALDGDVYWDASAPTKFQIGG